MVKRKSSNNKKWSKKEKEKLFNLYLVNGNCWTTLSKHFRGRSPVALRRAYKKMDLEGFDPKLKKIKSIVKPKDEVVETYFTRVNVKILGLWFEELAEK